MKGILGKQEILLAEKCLATALKLGADKARITLNKSLMELFSTLDGELDKVSHCLDRSMSVCLFVDGRFGSFSTNRLDEEGIEAFLRKSISTVRMLAEDPCRNLPAPERTAKDAVSGTEMELFDPSYLGLSPEARLKMAMDASIFKASKDTGLISEEGEYSDSVFDSYVIDSQGLRCRHTETSFEYGVEVTVKDSQGNRYSGYWWDATSSLAKLKISTCGETALRRALSQIGPRKLSSGKYTMVVDNENSSRLVSPLLSALSGQALQQKNSFLLDTLGKKVFPEWLDILDKPHEKGRPGARLFDSEGVATKEAPVIENGVIRQYFINTYMSGKMGMEPTVEDATRPVLMPCVAPSFGKAGKLDREGIMALVGEGILVTGFNGGNSNSATGDFSFGIDGYLFKGGKVVHPVREMLITGNLITLWNNLLAAGDDPRPCKSKVIPTLAFKDVDFSA
ncbi:MAG: TldD/PmbA family protein [Bacteroidales bacterium]|nr:TldD/PmbA family protein [Bacteroidales bacterium]